MVKSLGKVALDAATPKHAILASILYNELKKRGYEVEVLAREETQTLDLLKLFKIPYLETGKYGGATLEGKLEATIQQEIKILNHFKREGKPDVFWTHGNVSGVRVAYGLGIPIVYNNDTLHNEPVVKLTVPLTTKLVIPEAYKKREWSRYGIDLKEIIRFKGTEEVAWVKNLKINKEEIFREAEVETGKLVVVRGSEHMACYSSKETLNLRKILRELSREATVMFLPRYRGEEKLSEGIKNVTVPKKTVFAAGFVGAADLVVGSGGTICKEATLQGTPTISFHFEDAVTKYLERKNFPIWYIPTINEVIKKSEKILRDPEKYRVDTSKKLKRMESPVPAVLKSIESVSEKLQT